MRWRLQPYAMSLVRLGPLQLVALLPRVERHRHLKRLPRRLEYGLDLLRRAPLLLGRLQRQVRRIYATVTLPLHYRHVYRHIAVTGAPLPRYPLRYRHVTVTLPSHCRHITVTLPSQVRRFYALHGMAVGQVVGWQPEGAAEEQDEPALWRVAMADGDVEDLEEGELLDALQATML